MFQKEFQIILHRQLSYPVSLGNDALGNLQRISSSNLLDGFRGPPDQLPNGSWKPRRRRWRTAKQEVEKEFPKEQELERKGGTARKS